MLSYQAFHKYPWTQKFSISVGKFCTENKSVIKKSQVSLQNLRDNRGVKAEGMRGAAVPSAMEVIWFFGENAYDSGNGTWGRTLQNNASGGISKTGKWSF